MSATKIKKLAGLIFLGLAFAGTPAAWATPLTASGGMTLSNLRFSSPNPNAQLVWTNVWYGTAASHSQDTVSGQFDNFQNLLGNNGSITASTTSTHANSTVSYSVTNGNLIGTGGGNISLTAQAWSGGNGAGGQAYAAALGSFDNYFTVQGGTFGNPVQVTFLLDYSGQMDVTGSGGSYFAAVSALLKLEGLNGILLASDLVQNLGTNNSLPIHQSYTGTLAFTTTLLFGTEYWLFASADSEFNTTNNMPEPGTLSLLALGAAAACRRKRSRYSTPGDPVREPSINPCRPFLSE